MYGCTHTCLQKSVHKDRKRWGGEQGENSGELRREAACSLPTQTHPWGLLHCWTTSSSHQQTNVPPFHSHPFVGGPPAESGLDTLPSTTPASPTGFKQALATVPLSGLRSPRHGWGQVSVLTFPKRPSAALGLDPLKGAAPPPPPGQPQQPEPARPTTTSSSAHPASPLRVPLRHQQPDSCLQPGPPLAWPCGPSVQSSD